MIIHFDCLNFFPTRLRAPRASLSATGFSQFCIFRQQASFANAALVTQCYHVFPSTIYDPKRDQRNCFRLYTKKTYSRTPPRRFPVIYSLHYIDIYLETFRLICVFAFYNNLSAYAVRYHTPHKFFFL